ncbi:MAG: hypothetical protein ABSB28_08965 [Candidatus Bathyarchaeia archaeon]
MPYDHIWLHTVKPYKLLPCIMLGNTIIRLSDEAGVPFTLHDGRRWVNTALEQIGISTNWARKIRGRKAKERKAPTVRPNIEQLRAKFREAVPFLEFTSETSTSVEDRLKKQEAISEIQTKLVSGTPLEKEDYDKIKAYGIKLFSKRTDISTTTDHGLKKIPESELLEHLQEGWTIVHKLRGGGFIVQRPT